jgi:uncharacterized RDD family membrane protein YckC
MNWYYVENGKQSGWFNDKEFAELVRTGKIKDDTLVRHEGMANWLAYSQVESELKLNPESSKTTLSPLVETPNNTSEAVCNECGKIFPIDEMIRHGNARICSNCKPVFMQKLSEGAQLNTGELNYARISSRFAAAILDGLILGAVNVGIGLIAGLSAAQAVGAKPKGAIALQIVLFAIQISIGIGYEVVLIGKYGATLGKMACKIKVVTADGGRVSYLRALGRYFAKLLSAFTCMIGYIIALFDNPQRRALHDHICNTRVINK